MHNSKNEAVKAREAVDVLVGEVEEHGDGAGQAEEARGAGESDEDSQHEEAMPKVVARDPGAPTQAEIDEHNVDHIPYRSWCECCVMGRGTGEQHRAGPEGRVPVIAFDYLFVSQSKLVTREELDDEEEKKALIKILLIKDVKSKATFAHVVRHKGIEDDEYAARRLVEDVAWLGYSKVILKCDGERAIVKLLKEGLKRIKTGATDASYEHPPHVRPEVQRLRGECREAAEGSLQDAKIGLGSEHTETAPGVPPSAHLVGGACCLVIDDQKGRR